jgi:predicted RNA-binding protein with PUA domain
MLTIGQCTQALKDKLKEDANWDSIADSYDSIGLLGLIEKYVLKQTESHYPYLAVQEELRSILNFAQGDDMTLGMYYEKFTTRVAIAERAGCSFVTQSLLDSETEVLYTGQSYSALGAPEKLKVDKAAKDKYLAVLFLMRSGKRHLQLQNDIKNDHSKGVDNAFPATVAAAMQILNDFKPVITETTKQVSLGTAFPQDGAFKKQSKGRLSDEAWNALSPEAKSALVKKRKDEKAAKSSSGGSGDSKKSSSSKKDDDDSSVSSNKSISDLQKENKRLRRVNKRTKAALVTTIEEGNEDDSSLSEDGSQSFNAAIAGVQEGYPELHDGIVLAHKIPHLRLREEILIDSQTTHDVFCNPKYVGKVRKAKKNLHLSTNGGGMVISLEANVLGLYPEGYDDTVYYDKDAITNILSFKKMARVYRITYDSDVSKTFTVHRESHGLVNLRFTMHPCGLHVLEQPNQGSMFILTVEENKRMFNKRQIAGATNARNTYEALLCPSIEDFEAIIGSGGIRGSNLTTDDAKISFKIFGPSVIKDKGN